jgi:hypothetical protein
MSYKSHPKTLGDYIDNVVADEQSLEKEMKDKKANKPKLTFEEWLRTVCFQAPTAEAYDLAKDAWKAAQENV